MSSILWLQELILPSFAIRMAPKIACFLFGFLVKNAICLPGKGFANLLSQPTLIYLFPSKFDRAAHGQFFFVLFTSFWDLCFFFLFFFFLCALSFEAPTSGIKKKLKVSESIQSQRLVTPGRWVRSNAKDYVLTLWRHNNVLKGDKPCHLPDVGLL